MPAAPTVADAADRGASDQLFAEVYRRLKAMASRQRRRAGGASSANWSDDTAPPCGACCAGWAPTICSRPTTRP